MKISLPFKAFSVNKQFAANKKYGMLKDAKDFCYQVNWQLQKYKDEFEEIRNNFDETLHGLEVEIIHYYKNFFNSKGGVSNKVLDITNTEKLLMDLIIDKEHYGPAPYLSPNLKLNDRNVIKLTSSKRAGGHDFVTVEINIVLL